LRPDIIGVMFDLMVEPDPPNMLQKLYLRGHPLGPAPHYTHPGVGRALEIFRRGMLPIWLSDGGDLMYLAHPVGEPGEILRTGRGAPSSTAVAAEVARWRARYERMDLASALR
jgi:hypothetical protein